MSIRSLVATGTKVWLDSIDPEFIQKWSARGITGATSNPIIIADLVKTGRFDDEVAKTFQSQPTDAGAAWAITDKLVSMAQDAFKTVWKKTRCDDGWVSFELDPMIDASQSKLSHDERVDKYIELGKKWGLGRQNRMIKVPATSAGLDSIEELVAAGVSINVTLIFTSRQYEIAREAAWRGAQRRRVLEPFKSVYSIFISRVDVYTAKQNPHLSPEAQGMVGIVTAKRVWKSNQDFWADKRLHLKQDIIFASTGTKDPSLPPDKYVEALAGSDIQTNPPATIEAVERLNKSYTRRVDQMPPQGVLDEIDAKVDMHHLEHTLMDEGVKKFADPYQTLVAAIASKREALIHR